jgi:hypothetical protein
MPTRGSGVGDVVHEVAERASALARLEAELAVVEIRGKIASLGAGAVVLAGAAIFGLFTFGFVLAAIAAGLATFLDTWLALLIVAIVLLVATTALAIGGLSLVKRGVPPIPERAVTEAKLTVEALKGNGRA